MIFVIHTLWLELTHLPTPWHLLPKAYSPLVKAEKLSDARLASLASRKGVTTAQLLLR